MSSKQARIMASCRMRPGLAVWLSGQEEAGGARAAGEREVRGRDVKPSSKGAGQDHSQPLHEGGLAAWL